jgi:hypothetical protein
LAKDAIVIKTTIETILLKEELTASLSYEPAALNPVLALATINPHTRIDRELEKALRSRSP